MLHCMSFTITYISTFHIIGDYQFKHYIYFPQYSTIPFSNFPPASTIFQIDFNFF